MSRKVIINTDNKNRYGFSVLTSGININNYTKNPVLLAMHQRGILVVVGRVENLVKEKGRLVGELVFDEKDEYAKEIARKWDEGFLNAVSMGFDVNEINEDESIATKSELLEISVVDVPGNGEAVKELKLNSSMTLSYMPERILQNKGKSNNNNKLMDYKEIALALGLDSSANLSDILKKIGENQQAEANLKSKLQTEVEKVTKLSLENKEFKSAGAKELVANAKNEGLIGEGDVEMYEKLASDNIETCTKVFENMRGSKQSEQTLEKFVSGNSGQDPKGGEKETFTSLSKDNPQKLAHLKANNKPEFERLYKEEYGTEYKW